MPTAYWSISKNLWVWSQAPCGYAKQLLTTPTDFYLIANKSLLPSGVFIHAFHTSHWSDAPDSHRKSIPHASYQSTLMDSLPSYIRLINIPKAISPTRHDLSIVLYPILCGKGTEFAPGGGEEAADVIHLLQPSVTFFQVCHNRMYALHSAYKRQEYLTRTQGVIKHQDSIRSSSNNSTAFWYKFFPWVHMWTFHGGFLKWEFRKVLQACYAVNSMAYAIDRDSWITRNRLHAKLIYDTAAFKEYCHFVRESLKFQHGNKSLKDLPALVSIVNEDVPPVSNILINERSQYMAAKIFRWLQTHRFGASDEAEEGIVHHNGPITCVVLCDALVTEALQECLNTAVARFKLHSTTTYHPTHLSASTVKNGTLESHQEDLTHLLEYSPMQWLFLLLRYFFFPFFIAMILLLSVLPFLQWISAPLFRGNLPKRKWRDA